MNHSDKNKQALLECIKDTDEIIVFDTETTGLDAKMDQIIQFSGIKVRVFSENGLYRFEELEVIDEFIKPRNPVCSKIEDLTSITNTFLADKPAEETVFEKIHAFFGDNPVISGYNVAFDIAMVSGLYGRMHQDFRYKNSLDVLAYARDLVSKKDLVEATGEDRFRQECIAKVYGLDAKFHLAIEDARVTLKLLFAFINEFLCENETAKTKVKVKRVVYKEGYSHDRTGAYVQTDLIPVFFAYKYKQWYPTKKANLPAFETIDLTELEKDVLKMTGLSSVSDIVRFRGDTSSRLGIQGSEEVCEVKGINLWEKYGKRRIYVSGLSINGKWFNCFFDIPTASWSCSPFTAASMEKLVLTKTGQGTMTTLVNDLVKKAS